jgi:hypothetical protein
MRGRREEGDEERGVRREKAACYVAMSDGVCTRSLPCPQPNAHFFTLEEDNRVVTGRSSPTQPSRQVRRRADRHAEGLAHVGESVERVPVVGGAGDNAPLKNLSLRG